MFSVKPPKAAASSGNLAGKVGLYPKERIGVVPTMQTSRHQGQEWIAKGEGEGKEERRKERREGKELAPPQVPSCHCPAVCEKYIATLELLQGGRQTVAQRASKHWTTNIAAAVGN